MAITPGKQEISSSMIKYVNVLFLAFIVSAQIVHAEELLKARTSWDGGDIHYPEGEAEITSVILNIEEGVTAKFHCHPVPTLGYVLSGVVEVETRTGNKTRLRAGDSVVEVMRTVHRGNAVGGPAKILVFYAGAVSVPNTVLPEDDEKNIYCSS
jgi:quercetin dioxygenase-like cupin family protein